MKHILIFLMSIFWLFPLKAQSSGKDIVTPSEPLSPDTTFTITFVDNYSTKNSGVSKLAKPIKSRAERTSAHAGRIKIEAPGVPQEIVDCAEIALSIWESIIKRNSVFKIEIQNTDTTGDITTTVSYYNAEGINYPISLKYLDTDNIEYDQIPLAGIIQINNTIDWDYSVDGSVDNSKKNLTYGLIRAIGRILGFGSSVKCQGNGYAFSHKLYYSIFDTLVRASDGTSLTSVPINKGKENAELLEYINKGEHKIEKDHLSYKLAPGPYSNSNPPFCALEEGLMKPILNVGDYCIQVDDDVWAILKMIGWELKSENTLEIVCPDATNGIVDVAESHDFQLANKNIPLTEPQWTLTLPMPEGKSYVLNLKDNGGGCTVPGLSNEASRFDTDINGFIRGRLEYSALFNGIKVKARPYTVFFDTDPRILSVDINEIEYSDDRNFFRVHYTVRYRGADYLEVQPKEEFSSIVAVQKFKEPIMAKGCTSWLFTGGTVRLKFYAKTDTKECARTIVFDAYTQEYRALSRVKDIDGSQHSGLDSIDGCLPDAMDVFSIDGILLLRNASAADISSENLGKGTYIVMSRDINGKIHTSKIRLQ